MKLLEGKWIGLFLGGKIAACSLHLWGTASCVSCHLVEVCVALRILAWTGEGL